MPIQEQERRLMRWILFWVFIALFVVIVLGTLAAVFLGFGNLRDTERSMLFNTFLVEIGVAIIGLFYSIFELKRKGEPSEGRLRLNIGKFQDVRKLIGKTASLAPLGVDGNGLEEIQCKILDDNGPYLPIDLPSTAYSVYISVSAGEKQYSGSFVVGTYLVDLFEEQT